MRQVDHPTSEPRTPPQLTTSGGPVCMAGAANIAITGVTVYHQDPDAASPMTAATILITNGVVTCMGAGAACTVPGPSVARCARGTCTAGRTLAAPREEGELGCSCHRRGDAHCVGGARQGGRVMGLRLSSRMHHNLHPPHRPATSIVASRPCGSLAVRTTSPVRSTTGTTTPRG